MPSSVSIRHHDVVVIGGGASGIATASSAAANGADTLLIDAGPVVGGELLSGIPIDGCLNTRGEWIVGGFLRSLLDDLERMGGFVGAFFDWRTIWVVCCDPERMKLAVINRLRVTGVNLLLYSFVDEVVTDGGRVTGVVVLNKAGRTLITGDVFLDCSGDGDVAVGAGAQFLHGDGKGTFQPVTMVFRMAGVDTQKLLDFAEANPENLALGENPWLNKGREECLREPIAQGYPKVFLKADGPLLSKAIADGELYPTALLAVTPVSTDRREVALNTTRVANVDATDTAALSATMPQLVDQVWNCQGFLRKRVPGFEEAAFAGLAPRIGIRETRRIVGEHTLTGEDVLNAVKRDDGIAKGGHHVDIHGDGSYDIPLGCLLPKGLENVGIAGRCLSADREAHGSARVMGTCMAMGQAIGTAAAMVCEGNVPSPVLGDVPMQALRDRLVAQGLPKVFFVPEGPLLRKAIEEGRMYPTSLVALTPNSLARREVSVNTTRIAAVNATDTNKLSSVFESLHRQVEMCAQFLRTSVPGMEDAVISALPPRIGIRETRRVVGDYVLTGDDVLSGRKFEDGVAKGCHELDIHGSETGHRRENIRDGGSYDTPFGCLVPKDTKNLLVVGRCLSADREAHSTARVMGSCMGMGQAAGTAAAMAREMNDYYDIRAIDVGALRARLKEQGAVLDGIL